MPREHVGDDELVGEAQVRACIDEWNGGGDQSGHGSPPGGCRDYPRGRAGSQLPRGQPIGTVSSSAQRAHECPTRFMKRMDIGIRRELVTPPLYAAFVTAPGVVCWHHRSMRRFASLLLLVAACGD